MTKLGRLVKDGRIKSVEDVYLYSMPVKEPEIMDYFFKDSLKDEVMCIKPVQKQTSAGQRTRFKAYVAVGDNNGHVGLGQKCAKEVANSIRAAITVAKLNVIPVRMGYWGSRMGKPHTVPCKLNAKCGSVRMRLIPAPRGTGIVAGPAPKKLLTMAGIRDVYSSATGHTRTTGNFIKATFECLRKSYDFLTPDMWAAEELRMTPFQEFTDVLAKDSKFAKEQAKLAAEQAAIEAQNAAPAATAAAF